MQTKISRGISEIPEIGDTSSNLKIITFFSFGQMFVHAF